MSKPEPTVEEIAEQVATRGLPFSAFRNEQEWKETKAFVSKEIVSALRARDETVREECAAIAEACHPQPCICTTCLIHAEAGAAIRRTIRKGKGD